MVAAAEVAALVRSLAPHDAYLIACFGDPGLDAARELTDAPVVGIGEAAYTPPTLVAKRFGDHHHAAARHPGAGGGGRSPRASLSLRRHRAAQHPGRRAGQPPPRHHPGDHRRPARRLVAERGAEALILACGGMADVARAVSEAVGVPVCDGVAFGVDAGLLAVELRASHQQGAAPTRWPEPIPYVGMPSDA